MKETEEELRDRRAHGRGRAVGFGEGVEHSARSLAPLPTLTSPGAQALQGDAFPGTAFPSSTLQSATFQQVLPA